MFKIVLAVFDSCGRFYMALGCLWHVSDGIGRFWPKLWLVFLSFALI